MSTQSTGSYTTTVVPPATILAIGAIGSIGRLVVAEALQQGYKVRALVRDEIKARHVLPPQTELIVAEVTQQDWQWPQ